MMSTYGHFDFAKASDDTQRHVLNGVMVEMGLAAYAISKAKWRGWPDKLVEALRKPSDDD